MTKAGDKLFIFIYFFIDHLFYLFTACYVNRIFFFIGRNGLRQDLFGKVCQINLINSHRNKGKNMVEETGHRKTNEKL